MTKSDKTSPKVKRAVDERLTELKGQQHASSVVKQTIESEGWEKHISPRIDGMIQNTIGGKQANGFYNPGQVMQDKEHSPDYYFGYRMALMDLNNWALAKARQLKSIEEQMEAVGKKGKFFGKPSKPKSSYDPRGTNESV